MIKIACIIGSAPYGQRNLRDALDVIMASASFDLPPTLFFIDDGVFSLLKAQSPEYVCQKNTASMLQSLPLFEVDNLFVCQQSLDERGLNTSLLITNNLKLIEKADISEQLGNFTQVLTF